MSKTGSIVHQCNELINGQIDCRGESKYQAKQEAIAEIKAESGAVNSHSISQHIGIFSDSAAKQNFGYWVEACKYVKQEFGIKDIQGIRSDHIGAYLDHKMDQDITNKTFSGVCASMEKFGVALRWETGAEDGRYNFSPVIDNFREEAKVILADNPLVNRAFDDPSRVAGALQSPTHQTAAALMYEGGARISEISVLKADNLKGLNSTGEGQILLTNTKGGEERIMTVSAETYIKVSAEIEAKGTFRFDQVEFRADLRQACASTGENMENGAHGFRYNFAQESYAEKLEDGMTVQEAKQAVAEELGHHRASITERYLGRR